MALFRYFKREKNNLPDPYGPLAQSVPSTSIAAANSEVLSVIESKNNKKRGQYAKYTPEQKSMIRKRAAEHGVVAAVRYYIRQIRSTPFVHHVHRGCGLD